MENEYGLDPGELMENLDRAEVLCIYCPALRKTLLIDARSDGAEGPLVRVVPMVSTPEERFRSLRRLRPRLPRPEGIVLIPWTRYVASLEKVGVLGRLQERFLGLGFPQAAEECRKAYEELLRAEQEEKVAAIRGEGYHTLWERK